MRVLDEGVRGKVLYHEPMARHTSYRIGGPADIYFQPADEHDIAAALAVLEMEKIPVLILGMGTNVLVRDGGIRGCVIDMRGLAAIERTGEKTVYARAGTSLMGLIRQCAKWSLSGLEALAGIPGSVGGAVVMNAGAHDVEVGRCVEVVTVITSAGTADRSHDQMNFRYRGCGLGEGEIVLGACLGLFPGNSDEIDRIVADKLAWRKERQPLSIPSAGSVFKNPADKPAGALIDAAGLKGATVGGAQVSELHANFIVNRGNAAARDVLALVEKIRDTVKKNTGIALELEIKVVGEDAA